METEIEVETVEEESPEEAGECLVSRWTVLRHSLFRKTGVAVKELADIGRTAPAFASTGVKAVFKSAGRAARGARAVIRMPLSKMPKVSTARIKAKTLQGKEASNNEQRLVTEIRSIDREIKKIGKQINSLQKITARER